MSNSPGTALGFAEPAPWLRRLTYPEGYNIEELGTHALSRREEG